MTGNGQLTRGAFIMNDFSRNPHFSQQESLHAFEKGLSMKSRFKMFFFEKFYFNLIRKNKQSI